MKVSRRELIKTGFIGAAALGLGGVGLGLAPTAMTTPRVPLRALSDRSFSILVAVAQRIVPTSKGFPSAKEIGVAEKVDSVLGALHPADVADFENGLFLMENALAGLLFEGRWGTFTGNSPEVQDRILEDFRTSRLSLRRTIYRAVYGLVSGAYWSSPRLYEQAGYGGPPDFGSGRAAVPSRPPIKRRPGEPPGPLDSLEEGSTP